MTLTTSSYLEPGQRSATHTRAGRGRGGFTLIELLVVVAIIAVLVALTGAAIQMTVVRQRNLNTKSDVNKLQQALDVEYSRVVKKCADDRVATPCRIPQQIRTYCGDDNRALAVWTAMNLYRQFPNSFAEINSQPNVGGYQFAPMTTFAKVASLPGPGGSDESGVLLYIILTDKSVAGGGAMASGADNLGLQHAVSIGGGSYPAFKDAWGNSIGFTRWDQSAIVQAPPLLGSPSPMNAANHDPLDPRNLILGWTNYNSVPTSLLFNGHNRIPGVYSPGQDKTVGTADDVYGYVVKQYGN